MLLIFITIVIIIFTPFEFFTSTLADNILLSLSDNRSPQVSRTLLSILTDIIIIYSFWVFTWAWVTASLPRAPGLSWVFRQITTGQYSGGYQSFLWIRDFPNPFPIWVQLLVSLSLLWLLPSLLALSLYY